MKKLLLLLLFPFVLFACGSDDDESPKVESIKIENLGVEVYIGDEHQLIVKHSPSELQTPKYTWTSLNPEIISVDENGKIKALKEGQATIKVTASELNLHSTIIINVQPIQATSVKLLEHEKELIVGQTYVLKYTIEPDNTTNKEVTWKSSDESIVTIDNGTIVAISDGEAVITISKGSLKDECKIIVKPIRVTSVQLNTSSERIELFEPFQLLANVSPSNAKNTKVVWKSSDVNVATVDANGNVVTKAIGSAKITATTEDGGFEASASIAVYNFTENINVTLSKSMVITSWNYYTEIIGKLNNNSKKTIVATMVIIYENGVPIYKNINHTLKPSTSIKYSIKRDGNFKFVYEYQYNGVTYSTL